MNITVIDKEVRGSNCGLLKVLFSFERLRKIMESPRQSSQPVSLNFIRSALDVEVSFCETDYLFYFVVVQAKYHTSSYNSHHSSSFFIVKLTLHRSEATDKTWTRHCAIK
jgi:hypothetical protein